MEAVAAAASIAGIITVVGQSIDGLIKFSDFFSDISSASKTINRLLADINSLIQVLEDIGDVLERAQARRRDKNLAHLDIKLTDCAKDVQIWLATARLLRPSSDSGGKALLRKFRLAVNNTAVQTIREEIGRHKQTLCLSLEVFGRTIDIDTSAQVHQMGGRFSEALSTSLTIHGAHEEALRRIEHYSMTSMHSSAHSIRSMDSICTRLSRLEASVTSASSAHPLEIGTQEFHGDPSSSRAERQVTAAPEAVEIRSLHLSVHGLLAEHNGTSSAARDSAVELSSQQDSSHGAGKGLDRRTQSQRTRQMALAHQIKPKNPKPSTDDLDDENLAGEVNKSSALYAEFSKTRSRRNKSPAIDIDTAAIHHLLTQSLSDIYPPEVVKYASLHQVITLCEDHLDLLDRKPTIQISTTRNLQDISHVDSSIQPPAPPSLLKLKNRLLELQTAIKVSKEQCLRAGYSLSELDRLLAPPGTRSWALAGRPARMREVESGDDSSSVYSEDFHSTVE